jgi:putative spermidine/putrescine transport system permease protein
MSARRKAMLRDWQLVLPLLVFFVIFVLGPFGLLVAISLFANTSLSSMGADQYIRFFSDTFNVLIVGQTLWIALQATILASIVGYPLAYIYTLSSPTIQRILLFLIVLPLLTSAVVRTFAWIVILGREGIVNSMLLQLGLIESPLRILYTPTAIVVALAQIEMPLMVLPIITALTNIDPHMREASEVLGARKWRTFFKVTLPLSIPGLLAGCLLVFAAAASAFVVHTLVGGGQNMLMPLYIYQQAIQMNNYPFAAAIAMILLSTVLAVVMAVNFIGRRSRGFVHA